jgi:hypothetical protein
MRKLRTKLREKPQRASGVETGVRRLAFLGSVAISGVAGVLALAAAAHGNVDNDPSRWLLTRLGMAGTVLAGLVLIASAASAVRRPRRAGWIPVASAPVLGFLLGYPTAGYLVWDERGGILERPLWTHAIVFACLFYLPFVLSVLSRRNSRRAWWVFIISAAAVTPLLALSHWAAALATKLAACAAPFVLSGGFWLWTAGRGWLPTRVPHVQSGWRRAGFALGVCLGTVVLAAAAAFGFAIAGSSLFRGNCSGDRPFLRPLNDRHVAATARILWAGYGLRAAGNPVGD